MVAVSYFRGQDQDPGLTTEIVLVLTALLGGMCMQAPQTAAAIAVAVTVLLYAKAWLHNLVITVISKDELDDALIFAAATLVVLPLVPNRQMGPYLALNPHSIWIVIVLVMAISAAGYVAVRLFGARFGLPLAGAISGFISSTATIGAMGSRARKSQRPSGGLCRGCRVVDRRHDCPDGAGRCGNQHAHPVQSVGASASGRRHRCGLWGSLYAFGRAQCREAMRRRPAVSSALRRRLSSARSLRSFLVISAGLQERFGGAGVLLAAVVAGLVDTHAAAISVATLVASGKVAPQDAVVPILAALTSNTLSKIVMAATSGGWAFALRVVPGLVLVALAAWVGMFAALIWT